MSHFLIGADAVRGAPTAGNAVEVRNGSVVAIGDLEHLRKPGLTERRFPGGTIVPGLRDAHVHPTGYATALERLVAKDFADFDELISALRQAASELPAGDTLVGIRLDDETLAERRLPDRHVLDAASTEHPIILYRYCGHIAVANTAALESAGVGPETPDPFGGAFDRDEDGRPNGILRETAVTVIGDMCGDRASGLEPGHVVTASRHLATLGLTSIGAMVSTGAGPWANAISELDLVLGAAPELAVTMHAMVMTMDPDELERAASRLERAGPRLRFLGVKVITDGSLGGHTAAMDDPYEDQPDERGMLRVTREDTLAVSRRALDLGGVVAIHAIGDQANAFTLDVFETLREEGAPDGSLRVEHASVMREKDFERMGSLGVIASVQPAFLASEQAWLADRVGARTERTYAFRTMAESGALLAGGSDCPVEPPHPLWGMAAARQRGTIAPREELSPEAVLAAFTSGAARSMQEAVPLAVGSPADITVLDLDPLTSEPAVVRNGGALATFVAGDEASPEPGVAWKG